MIHLAAGLIFFVALYSIILLGEYNSHLYDEMSKLNSVFINARKMKTVAEEMETAVFETKALLPADYDEKSNRELLLARLDEIKKLYKSSKVEVSAIVKDDLAGEFQIPADIVTPLRDYSAMLAFLRYLQTRTFPHITIKSVNIRQTGDFGTVVYLKCLLRMPIKKYGEGLIRDPYF